VLKNPSIGHHPCMRKISQPCIFHPYDKPHVLACLASDETADHSLACEGYYFSALWDDVRQRRVRVGLQQYRSGHRPASPYGPPGECRRLRISALRYVHRTYGPMQTGFVRQNDLTCGRRTLSRHTLE
jgi:hypothetical protein